MREISKSIFDNLEYKLTGGMLTINPDDYKDKGGMDGFFIACIERIKL